MDHEFAESLKFNIRHDSEHFLDAARRARSMGLNHTMEAIEEALISDIKAWKDDEVITEDFESFIETTLFYESLSSDFSSINELLKEAIHIRLNHKDSALTSVFDATVEQPNLLFIEALQEYILDENNHENVEGSFLAVQGVLYQLEQLHEKLSQ